MEPSLGYYGFPTGVGCFAALAAAAVITGTFITSTMFMDICNNNMNAESKAHETWEESLRPLVLVRNFNLYRNIGILAINIGKPQTRILGLYLLCLCAKSA
jgi:hypothetical protein